VIHSNPENYVEIDKMFEFFLKEIAEDRITKDAYLHLISECIAKWALLKPADSERLLSFLYHSEHSGHKYLFATLFRFLDDGILVDDYIRPKIAQLSNAYSNLSQTTDRHQSECQDGGIAIFNSPHCASAT
jgi:hypothetical protein